MKTISLHPIEPGAQNPVPTDPLSEFWPESPTRINQSSPQAHDYAQAIMELVPPLLVLNLDLRVKMANAPFHKHFCLSPEETRNYVVYELGHGRWNIPGLHTFLEEILPRHTFFRDFEVTHEFETLGRRTVLLSGRRVESLQRILLFIDDITERVESQAVMRASEIHYRRLFEVVEDGILFVDPDTSKVTDANPFLTKLLGYPRQELIGKELWEIGLLKDEKACQEAFRELKAKQVIRFENLPVQDKASQCHEVEFVSNLYDEDGSKVIQCNIRDITARKESEEQLKVSLKAADDLNSEIQSFYHTLSHELKTPLTSAREFVSLVMDGVAGPLNQIQLEYLGIAKESCDQLSLYINDLLDVTRLDTGKMSLEFQALPLAGLVERSMVVLAPAAGRKGINLSCYCQPNLPAIPIDKQRIMQVLNNLTANAVKFTPQGGHIHVSLSQATDPKFLQVSVRDTGRGIPKDQVDRIFEPLYQVKVGDAGTEHGIGLGLYICRKLVELHGGQIHAESDPGKGSVFTFEIPRHSTVQRSTVLIVDDEASILQSMRETLEKAEFKVIMAKGGAAALRELEQKRPNVVVLDLHMPLMDGAATLKEIRKKWGLLPVIVHTGYPESELMLRALQSSPFTCLSKPCSPTQLLETVRMVQFQGVAPTRTRPDGSANKNWL